MLDHISKNSTFQGLYSLIGKTSYRKISWSLEAARFGFKLFQSLWNLAGTSAALLPRCLSNFRAIRPLQHPISRLREFTRFGGKTSYRLVNRGSESIFISVRNESHEVSLIHKISVVQLFCNFGHLLANNISRDLSLRWVSDGYPKLHTHTYTHLPCLYPTVAIVMLCDM